MFGDPVANPRKWQRVPIRDIGTVITGNTPSRECSEYYGDAIEWIKSDNINTAGAVLTTAAERLSQTGREVARTVPSASVLVTCIAGSPSCIGNVAIADREVAFNQQINALVPKQSYHVFFLYYQFLLGKSLIQRASTGGMKGLVSKSRFEAVEFVAPPSPIQKCLDSSTPGFLRRNGNRHCRQRRWTRCARHSSTEPFGGTLSHEQLRLPATDWRSLHEAATKAESLAYPDPRASCFYARRALELAVAWLYKHDSALQLPYQDHLNALIHEPTFRKTVGEAVFNKARVIKDLGQPRGPQPQDLSSSSTR